jgi:hypothetical protein
MKKQIFNFSTLILLVSCGQDYGPLVPYGHEKELRILGKSDTVFITFQEYCLDTRATTILYSDDNQLLDTIKIKFWLTQHSYRGTTEQYQHFTWINDTLYLDFESWPNAIQDSLGVKNRILPKVTDDGTGARTALDSMLIKKSTNTITKIIL